MALDPAAMHLGGKVAVVTGGGAGIGRGIAGGMAAFGADVAVWERDPSTCAAAATEVGGLGVPTDVRDGDQVDAALARTLDRYGHVDILVNNAGGVFKAPLLETSDNGFDALYRANLRHVLLCTRRVARTMVDAGAGGAIINVTSIEGIRAAPGYAAYSAAKAGVIALTKSLGKELAGEDIAVNCITPAAARTRIFEQMTGEHIDYMLSKIPRARFVRVEEVAALAAWLASEENSFATGAVYDLSGGRATY